MRIAVLTGAIALGGCAAGYEEPRVGADHPASASAPVGAPLAGSRTLDLAGADPVAPASAAREGGQDGHEGRHAPAPSSSRADEHPEQLEEAGGGHEAPDDPGAGALYACPMHPEVTSDEPGQRCPKCGMALVRRRDGVRP